MNRKAKKTRLTINSPPTPTQNPTKKSSLPPEPIPLDVIFSIFSRLPVKSLMRFQCVAKCCSTMITDPLFALVHQPRPREKRGLLITCPTKLQLGQAFFVAGLNGGFATHCLTIPPRFSRYTTQSVNGIVCMDFGLCATICNPSTRKAFTLPFVIPKDSPAAASTYYCVNSFGFDPISKQYKVLNSWGKYPDDTAEYRVFTLGTNEWRLLVNGPPCYPKRESICINGIIYLRIWQKADVIAFDLQTERFCVIELPADVPLNMDASRLVRFMGRLAIVLSQPDFNWIRIWILEDTWIKHDVPFPQPYKRKGMDLKYFVVGSGADTCELLLAPCCLSTPFYVFFYDMERLNLRRIKISGLPEYDPLDTFCNDVAVTNFVDNILYMA